MINEVRQLVKKHKEWVAGLFNLNWSPELEPNDVDDLVKDITEKLGDKLKAAGITRIHINNEAGTQQDYLTVGNVNLHLPMNDEGRDAVEDKTIVF